ncbi:DUF7716 domain-containing protein [Dyella sp. Tek66A03]|jgi:hypothetical protein|uniref:DUF7716 domain-containing protein n=1 Tax=Dyella sp. Tek66A03 TaxID=3458298 RepID=UPI0031B94708
MLVTLHEAIAAITDAFDDGDGWDRYAWVYLRGEITDAACRVYLSQVADEDDSLIDDNGEAMPAFAATHHLQHFLEAADFAEVLFVQRRREPASGVSDFAKALDYYRRHDAFLGMPAPPL